MTCVRSRACRSLCFGLSLLGLALIPTHLWADDAPAPLFDVLTDAERLLERAEQKAENGDLFGAAHLADRAAILKPHSPSTVYQQASIYRRLGRYDHALELIDATIDETTADASIAQLQDLRHSIVAQQSSQEADSASPEPPPFNEEYYPRSRWSSLSLIGGGAIATTGLLLATGLPIRSTIDRVEASTNPGAHDDIYGSSSYHRDDDLSRISTVQTLSITALTTGVLLISGSLIYRWRSTPTQRQLLESQSSLSLSTNHRGASLQLRF